jgi:hypothetical protein
VIGQAWTCICDEHGAAILLACVGGVVRQDFAAACFGWKAVMPLSGSERQVPSLLPVQGVLARVQPLDVLRLVKMRPSSPRMPSDPTPPDS